MHRFVFGSFLVIVLSITIHLLSIHLFSPYPISTSMPTSMPIPTPSQVSASHLYITEKPLTDKREYKAIVLDNGLEALLIHSPDTDKASTAMDVNVGAFADPEDLPGLAHFCEHLLFMGTKKYPKENEYSEYLSAHGGYSNAFTAAESTNYYFEVGVDHLEGALDRFAQFFVDPLFLESCKERELRAVDSENKKNLQNDTWRLYQLEKGLCNPRHPYHKFSTGNLETLKFHPESEGVDVRERLLEFYSSHYSANIMKLVILGREPIETLEKWIVDKFSDVRNTNRLPPSYEDEVTTKDQLGLFVRVKPVKDIKRLTIRFPIPDLVEYYETKPGHYLSHCIGHEGPGSLLQLLKKKGFANELSAGSMHICNGGEQFTIDIDLNPLGVEKYEEVIKLTFEYLKILQTEPVHEWMFRELQTVAEVNFKFKSETQHAKYVSNLAGRMHKRYPRERLLSYSKLTKYDATAIKTVIDCLRPDNMRMSLVSSSFDSLDQREKWYGTEYSITAIEPSFIEELKNVTPSAELYLPDKNEFIPENLDIMDDDNNDQDKLPQLIRNSGNMRVWYKPDTKFHTPKAYVRVYLKMRNAHTGPKALVMSQLGMNLLEDQLLKFSYAAEIAGLNGDVHVFKDGLSITSSGYSDKLHVLLEDITKTLKTLEIEQGRFEVLKERLIRHFKNVPLNMPYQQSGVKLASVINEVSYTTESQLAALEDVKFDEMQEFLSNTLLKEGNFEIGAFGNLKENEVLKIADTVAEILSPKPIPDLIESSSYLLSEGHQYAYNTTLPDENNVNSCVEYFVQVGDLATERRLKVALELLSSILSEPAFNQLRTKEQLGYVVFSGTRRTHASFGYRVLIQSEYPASYVQSRIETFLAKKAITVLDGLSAEEFNKFRESLAKEKLEKYQNLREEATTYFTEITNGFYEFDHQKNDVKILKTVTQEEVRAVFDKYIIGSSRTVIAIVQNAKKPKVLTDETLMALKMLNAAHELDIPFEQDEVMKFGEQVKGLPLPQVVSKVQQQLVDKQTAPEKIAQFLATIGSQEGLMSVGKWEQIQAGEEQSFKGKLKLGKLPEVKFE